MVAPHDTGDLVRSLVRVPGSGSDRSAGSECLDLARVSSLAASVQVPQTLPAALVTKVIRPLPRSDNHKLGSQVGVAAGILEAKPSESENVSASVSKTRQKPDGSAGETSSAFKRARIVYMTPQQVMSQSSRLVPISTPVGPVLFLPLQAQTESSATPLLSLNEASLSQIIEERNKLRQENQELQQRLSLFQQLFKDKKRLGSVVKRLGVEIP